MKTSLTISLDKRRKRSDNSFPIILRLGHFQRTTSIVTGFYVQEMYWDKRKREVKKAFKGVRSVAVLNQELRSKITLGNETIQKLKKSGEIVFNLSCFGKPLD
jgi:integrase/recombinase XerD